MFEQALPALIGAAGIAGAYVAYLAATKGAPAAWSAASGWWTSGKTALATLKGDVADAHAMIGRLETKLQAELETVKAELAAVKTKVGA